MSLNTFTNADKGIQLGLKIGAIEIKSKKLETENIKTQKIETENIKTQNIETQNIDVSTINGKPYKSGTGNTLSSDQNEDGIENKIIVEHETTKFTTDNIQIVTKKKFNKITSDGGLILSGGALDADYGIGIDDAQISVFQPFNVFTPTNLHNQPLKNVGAINGLSVTGGMYSGTSAGTLINKTDITSLKPKGVGTMKVSNGIKEGRCFHIQIAGDSSMVEKDTVQIIVIRNGVSLAESDIITVKNNTRFFEINANITIRSIDEIGSICTIAKFEYDDNVVRFNQVTTANTTRASTFDVLFKFVNRSDKSAVQTQFFNLQKIY